VLSVIFIIAGSVLDYPSCNPSTNNVFRHLDNIKPFNAISALGTMLFAYGSHASYPVILHDMKRPSHFTKSSYMAYAGVSLLFLPMSVISVLTYGGNIHSSIINSIQTPWIQQAVNAMILLHCFLGKFLCHIAALSYDNALFSKKNYLGPQGVLITNFLWSPRVFL
jgi:amino acid permease